MPPAVNSGYSICHLAINIFQQNKRISREMQTGGRYTNFQWEVLHSGHYWTVTRKVLAIKSTQRTNGTMLSFLERLSPFSNFFPCKFEVSHHTYNS